jgi:hypothetical protein
MRLTCAGYGPCDAGHRAPLKSALDGKQSSNRFFSVGSQIFATSAGIAVPKAHKIGAKEAGFSIH